MKLKSNKNNNQSSSCAIGIIDNQLEMPSTIVERTLQIRPFLCKTNPIFSYFSLKTKISLKNKANSNPIQTQFWPNFKGIKANSNPIKPNFGLISRVSEAKQIQILKVLICLEHISDKKFVLMRLSTTGFEIKSWIVKKIIASSLIRIILKGRNRFCSVVARKSVVDLKLRPNPALLITTLARN